MRDKKHDITPEQIREWLSEGPDGPPPGEEVEQAEEALLRFAESHAAPPPAPLREKILDKLRTLNEQKNQRHRLQPGNLPLLDALSNWLDWKEVAEGIAPPEDYENIYLHTLESNEKRELFVAWVKEFVPEEVHHDLLESFLILEGSCECFITGADGHTRTVRLGPGDYIAMETGETHDIRITSPTPAKAILQWVKIGGGGE
ncbi:MAG: cupin domain-containing protein [Phaeodactylibacter sp.]|nr:cupin domain-containing protein [Phaeodactylibacter sp.]MCB9292335.1 cupin domain-containing protein [Lewinellaceae bacterium]